MEKEPCKPMPPKQKAELKSLAALSDKQINTKALPEQKDWSAAVRGLFFVRKKAADAAP